MLCISNMPSCSLITSLQLSVIVALLLALSFWLPIPYETTHISLPAPVQTFQTHPVMHLCPLMSPLLPTLRDEQVNYEPSHNAPVPDLRELGKDDAHIFMSNEVQKGVKSRQAVGKDEYTFTQSRRCC